MLENLKRKLGMSKTEDVPATTDEVVEQVIEAVVEDAVTEASVETPVVSAEDKISTLVEELTAIEADLVVANAEKVKLSQRLSEALVANVELSEQLAKLTETLNQLETAKIEAAIVARKTSLAAVLPEDKVEATYASLANLSDEAFGIVLDGFKSRAQTEAKDPLFVEAGYSVQGTEEGVDATTKLLRERYNTKN